MLRGYKARFARAPDEHAPPWLRPFLGSGRLWLSSFSECVNRVENRTSYLDDCLRKPGSALRQRSWGIADRIPASAAERAGLC